MVFVFRDSYVLCIYVMNILCTFHIYVWVCYIRRWLKKFCSRCKNLNDQARSGKPKTVNSETALQAIEANRVSSIWRVSGELAISQWDSPLSWSQQNHLKLPNCSSPYQNITKFMTHSSSFNLESSSGEKVCEKKKLFKKFLSYLPTPLLRQDMTQGQFFKRIFYRFEFS